MKCSSCLQARMCSWVDASAAILKGFRTWVYGKVSSTILILCIHLYHPLIWGCPDGLIELQKGQRLPTWRVLFSKCHYDKQYFTLSKGTGLFLIDTSFFGVDLLNSQRGVRIYCAESKQIMLFKYKDRQCKLLTYAKCSWSLNLFKPP